ncbi:MAG TPA: ABC transporter ATP-binding protein, partial [Pseudorhodoplanes sp.]|nr:ABC transporter ATP-binding protein [Pseudorhodoplanes sp.]
VEEVIASSALHTYTVNGDDLNDLQTELSGKPGIDMVAPFGNSLHVSARDAGALERALAPYRKKKGLIVDKSEPSLEDVFIDLMARAKDNFQ